MKINSCPYHSIQKTPVSIILPYPGLFAGNQNHHLTYFCLSQGLTFSFQYFTCFFSIICISSKSSRELEGIVSISVNTSDGVKNGIYKNFFYRVCYPLEFEKTLLLWKLSLFFMIMIKFALFCCIYLCIETSFNV